MGVSTMSLHRVITTRTTFAFDVCFVWKLAPLADERNGFFIEYRSRRLTRSTTYLTLQSRTWHADLPLISRTITEYQNSQKYYSLLT
jgi:hypothetical protein